MANPRAAAGRAEQLAAQLKREILNGTYRPGDKLPSETSLAQSLGVHRVTVREAMTQLSQLHLVERRPGAGTVVLDYRKRASVEVIEYLTLNADGGVNVSIVRDLLEMAVMFSQQLVDLAAQRCTPAQLGELDVIVTRMRNEASLSRLLWLDFEFNATLADATQNVVARLVLNSVRGLVSQHAHLLETLWVVPGSVSEGYEHVVAALRARDARRASEIVHWVWASRRARVFDALGVATDD